MKKRLAGGLLALFLVTTAVVAFPQAALAATATPTGLSGHIRSVVADGTNLLAVCTDDGKIYKYDGNSWSENASLGSTCLYRDPGGRIFTGTSGGDLYLYGGGTTWTAFSNKPWSVPGINCVTADSSYIYCGLTTGYVYVVDNTGQWSSIGEPEQGQVRCMVSMPGQYGGWGGQCLYVGADNNTTTWYFYWPGLTWHEDWWGPDSLMRSLINVNGTRVMGCSNGHVYSTSDGYTFNDLGNVGTGNVNVVNWDSGTGYAGSDDGHVYWYDGSAWHDAGSAGTASPVRDITFMGNNLYFASDNGVYRLSTPQLETLESDTVTTSSANLRGTITTDGEQLADQRGFSWRPQGGSWSSWSEPGTFSEGETFTHGISGLDPNTTYEFKARAHNGAGWGEGGILTFKTLVAVQTLSTSTPSGIGQHAATFQGNITSTGGQNADQRGFRYREYGTAGWNQWTESGSFGSGAFSHAGAGLSPNTQYECQAISHNSAGWAYGSIVPFVTIYDPAVTTDPAASVLGTSATLNGTVTDFGGESAGQRGFRYQEAGSGNWVEWTDSGTFATGPYIHELTGLDPDTQYEFVATASNSDGIASGDSRFFTTLDYATLATGPATSIAVASATLNGDITATGGENATARGFRYRPSGAAAWTEWTEAGSFGAGTFSYPLTGLTQATAYEYQAMSDNSSGRAYGSTVQFTTDYETPSITGLDPGSGRAGDSVVISGTDFEGSGGTVWFGLLAAPITAWSAGSITVAVPAGLTSGVLQVTVQTAHGKVSPGSPFTVEPYAVRASVSGGHGSVEPATQEVEYNGRGSILINADTGYMLATITDNGAAKSLVNPYEIANVREDHEVIVTFSQRPVISGLSPDRGPAGTTVTISGKDFGSRPTGGGAYGASSSYVMFNTVQATEYVSWANDEIKVKVPTGSIPGPVTVTTLLGISNADHTFTTTYPVTSHYYLAEGSTAHGFSTYLNIENPNEDEVNASVNFLSSDGTVKTIPIGLPPVSQTTVNPADYIGQVDFSTRVDCVQGKTIAVDRTMVWTGPGAASSEAHASIGATRPEKVWYLAEGSSKWGFETWTLVENPNDRATRVRLSYMIEGGQARDVVKSLPANSRGSYSMADDIGEADASVLVTADLPVITERSMYRNNRREGSCSIGTPSPSSSFYLAEGTSGWGFMTYVLIVNPNPMPASVTVTYMTARGPVEQKPFEMPASSRKTLRVNDVLPGKDFSVQVNSDLPIVAERAMYWGAGSAQGESCHASSGVCSPHMTFYMPDGTTQGDMETYTLVANPNPEPVQVVVDYLMPEKSGIDYTITFKETIKPNSRKTYTMSDLVPDGRAAIKVSSMTPGKGIVVERSMYWNNRATGTDTIGGYTD